ncbi:MAG: DUF5723 family protein [Cytophagales bacterium]|jgi:hypothetical protein|nr:DUF5723 family protein [Cytophagales bacterium]
MQKFYFLLTGLVLSVFAVGQAQQMQGIAQSNYGGVFAVQRNPAQAADSRYNVHINFLSVIGGTSNGGFGFYPLILQGGGDNLRQAALNTGSLTGRQQLNQYSEVGALSMLINVKRRHGFALDFRTRSWLQGSGVPEHLGQAYALGLDHPDLSVRGETAASVRFAQMVVGQAALSYGGVLLDAGKHFVKGGATLKRIVSGTSFSWQADNLNYAVQINGSGAQAFRSLELSPFGYQFRYSNELSATGWGGDVGLVYEYRPKYEEYEYFMDGKKRLDAKQNKYLLRVGVSVLDLGSVRFADTRQQTGTSTAIGLSDTDLNTVLNNPAGGMSQVLGINSSDLQPSGGFSMTLPRTLNLDADWRIHKQYHLNLNLVRGFSPSSPLDVAQYNYFTVTPRIEGSKGAEVSFPVTFANGHVMPGVAFRAGPLVFGATNVPGIFGRGTATGGMAYASIVIWAPRRKEKDKDNDAVSDKRDDCKDVAGIWEFKGCPDTDLDGVEDKVDDCPTVAGSKEFKGCPDTDRDGILDKNDQCPELAGSAKFNGCPDSDNDNIPDAEDACPDKAGTLAFNGCPDTDGDNVPDDKDLCPGEAGSTELEGCPDNDGDGIPNKDDACPDKAGLVAAKGCPDTDGDGVTDKDDLCPTQKGLPSAKGCPDSDSDGVPDKDDECPKVSGSPDNKGCPMLNINYEQVPLYDNEKSIVQAAEDDMLFTGKYVAVAKSALPALDKLAALLKDKPTYRLVILELQHFENPPADEPREGRGKLIEAYLQKKQVSWGQLLVEPFWIESTEGIKKNTKSYILFRIVR